ncbi:hypothetical protein CEE39_05160 [bacterium (candidate division B38) B3_B38]|nr:MAG: hypothetical protein CEE39_05160 [bacterium (candidate division B38) B3_B38]
MANRGNTLYLTLFLIVATILIFSSFAQEKQKEVQQAPPFHTGGALFPEPGPVPPPAGIGVPHNPMVFLSRPKNYSAARASSYARNGGNHDVIRIPVGGQEVTLADIKGPGAITHVWTTFRGKGRDLIIRFYWEGSDHPSVEAPIGDFYGVAMGINAPINSYPIQVSSEGRARNCWWYMPFNKSARITVTNVRPAETLELDYISLYYYIDYQVYSQPIKDITYFHARFREIDPTQRGEPVKLVEVEGDGHYVGVAMGQRARTPGWFGEGDDIITVDGKLSFLGTGTEDYFSDAWGFRVFSDLYHGAPVYEGREVGDSLSVYRFHIVDPIPFRKTFKFEIEHWPWFSCWPNTGRGYYSSVGFWYQKGIHKPWPRLEIIISAEPWDPTKGRWHVENALEAEDLGILEYQTQAGKGARPHTQFLMPNLSGDHMLSFDSGGKGEFSLAVPVKEAGKYTVKIHYVRAVEYGIVQLSVNGEPAGDPVDTYLRTDDLTRPVWPPREFAFPGVSLKAGLNVFRFSINSKNPESDGYKMGIDCLVLEKE